MKITRTEYFAYINSDAWRAVRERYRRSRLSKACAGCGRPWAPGFHLHHRTYKRLGCERLADLMPACESCHRALHDAHREACRLAGLHGGARPALWQFSKRFFRIRRRAGGE